MRTLAHHIDIDWLHDAYRRTRKDSAAGVDGQTAAEYQANLGENLKDDIEVVEIDCNINDPEFARVCAETLIDMMNT